VSPLLTSLVESDLGASSVLAVSAVAFPPSAPQAPRGDIPNESTRARERARIVGSGSAGTMPTGAEAR